VSRQVSGVVGSVPPSIPPTPPLVVRGVRHLPSQKRICEPPRAEQLGGQNVRVGVTFFVTVSPETRHTPCNPMQPSLCTISLRNHRNRAGGGRILDLQVLVELVFVNRRLEVRFLSPAPVFSLTPQTLLRPYPALPEHAIPPLCPKSCPFPWKSTLKVGLLPPSDPPR